MIQAGLMESERGYRGSFPFRICGYVGIESRTALQIPCSLYLRIWNGAYSLVNLRLIGVYRLLKLLDEDMPAEKGKSSGQFSLLQTGF